MDNIHEKVMIVMRSYIGIQLIYVILIAQGI